MIRPLRPSGLFRTHRRSSQPFRADFSPAFGWAGLQARRYRAFLIITVPSASHSLFTRAKLWSAAARCRFSLPRACSREFQPRAQFPASKLAGDKAAASCRTPKLRTACQWRPLLRNLCAPQTYGEKSGLEPAARSRPPRYPNSFPSSPTVGAFVMTTVSTRLRANTEAPLGMGRLAQSAALRLIRVAHDVAEFQSAPACRLHIL